MSNEAHLLKDVFSGNFSCGIRDSDLWQYVYSSPHTTTKIRQYKLKDVSHWIYQPCWSYIDSDQQECFISIYQVLIQPNRFKDHITRINHSDPSYPIIVVEDDYDSYGVILDGNHRFAKLLTTSINPNEVYIDVYYLTNEDLNKIRGLNK
jgi:disulfide oxidoreductase YuzD